MATTQIQLTDEQVKALERIAKAEGRSVAEVIESRIGAWFLQPPPVQTEDREELKRRALAAIGRFRSEETDLAAEHDRYLDEDFGR
ncbi:MAG TPA: ribbon-helix-helix protein, CopG family [Thermoanaerobaculia bacterium]|nr:ribbon-helix-helix protein, CopG family [Thermoanaerobaculia bacterium]